MPGSTRGELYEMPLDDAVSVLLADDAVLAGDDELRQAARHVVERHVAELVERYAPRAEQPALKLVR